AYEYHSGMAQDDLNVLSAFLAVAEERSFTQAAKHLNVSQSALSHAIRGLEEEIGVRLLARTTRSVAPTDAGEQLLRSLRPALTDIRAALGKISGGRDKPAGRVRLVVSPLAAASVLGPKLGAFARAYPDVVLDITTDESRVDLVAGGYDAGIHYGEFIEQDMVAVRVSPDHRRASRPPGDGRSSFREPADWLCQRGGQQMPWRSRQRGRRAGAGRVQSQFDVRPHARRTGGVVDRAGRRDQRQVRGCGRVSRHRGRRPLRGADDVAPDGRRGALGTVGAAGDGRLSAHQHEQHGGSVAAVLFIVHLLHPLDNLPVERLRDRNGPLADGCEPARV